MSRFLRFLAPRALWGAAAFSLAACSTNQVVIEHPFPAREKLSALASTPPPSNEKAAKSAPLAVSTWKLAGPFPAEPGSVPYAGDDKLARAVGKQLQARKSAVVITDSMQCFAREMGRFLAAHGKKPQVDLEAFMAGRCGVIPESPSFIMSTGTGTPTADVAAKQLEEPLKKLTGSPELGVWVGSGDKGAVVIAAYGRPKIKLTSMKVVREAPAEIQIRGRLLESTGWLRAHASSGALDATACAPPPKSSAVLPEFELRCPLKSDDAYAVLDMTAGAPNAVLGRRVLTLIAPVKGEIPSSYTSIELGGAQGVAKGLVAQLNTVRASLKRSTLEEVPAQSRTANTLLPHFFGASESDDHGKLDLISMGMLAGWDVAGPIRDASFLSFFGTYGDNAPSFLGELLFFPGTRAVLLDAGARKIAVATTQDQKNRSVFGLLSTYSLFEPQDHSQTEASLLDELDRQRAARGKKPIERAEETGQVLDPVMAKLARGEISPTNGLQDVVDTYTHKVRRQFQGMVYSTMVIDGWRPVYEGPLVELDNVMVAAKVGFFSGRGSNWGQYVTYLVFMPL